MSENPNDKTIRENQFDTKTPGNLNEDGAANGKKPVIEGDGKDDEGIEYKPLKHPHEYINPKAENEDHLEEEETETPKDRMNNTGDGKVENIYPGKQEANY